MKMKLQKRIAYILFMLIGCVNINYGQSSEIIEIPWGEEKTLTQGDKNDCSTLYRGARYGWKHSKLLYSETN